MDVLQYKSFLFTRSTQKFLFLKTNKYAAGGGGGRNSYCSTTGETRSPLLSSTVAHANIIDSGIDTTHATQNVTNPPLRWYPLSLNAVPGAQ